MRRGTRGDLSTERIKGAALALLRKRGSTAAVSLRSIAAELEVAPNALYTYVPDLAHIWHSLADDAVGRVAPASLRDDPCSRRALRTLLSRGLAVLAEPGVVQLVREQPVMGTHSFELSETVMALCEPATLDARDCHDLLLGWFYGRVALVTDGWDAATDHIRQAGDGASAYPRVFGRSAPDLGRQLTAILDGIDLPCGCPGPSCPAVPSSCTVPSS